MRKPLCLLAAALTLSTGAQAATPYPRGFDFKPYVGADLMHMHSSYQDDLDEILNKNTYGGNVHIGVRLHKYFGVEAGYLDTLESEKTYDGVNTKFKLQGGTFDVMGYYPVGMQTELIGTAGVSVMKITAELNAAGGHIDADATETKGRVGAGAQYWLTPRTNARALVRYQDADFTNTMDHAVVSTVGVNWQF